MKVDANASTEDHYRALRTQGQAYIAQALRRNSSPVMRQRILMASLRYLQTRTRTSSAGMHSSQGSHASQVVLSQAMAATGPTSSFQSLLASSLDQDISTDVLIEACAKAADSQLLPILVKCLFILSNTASIRDENGNSRENVVRSQSQYEDDELFGVTDSDEENVNPQNGQREGGTRATPRSVCGKRNAVPNEISVGRTGQSFVDEFVSRLVEDFGGRTSSQGSSNDVFVSSVAKEAPLSESASRNVLRLLTRRMQKVDVFELPPFIYQLLLLASIRGNGAAKSQVLLHITQVFSELEKKTRRMEEISQNLLEEDEDAILSSTTSVRDLRQVQGTALLHIEYAVKQDPGLCVEIIKLAKGGVETPKHFLTSFGMGIILSLARSASTQSDILNVLRESVGRFGKEMSLRTRNLYAARVSMNDEKVLDPRLSLLYVAECTYENGWDYVKESLVNFAFLLLDRPIGDSTVSTEGNFLGEQLLFKLFKGHSSIRESILEQLTTRIALQEKSCHRAIFVLNRLAQDIPFYVLEHSRYVRDGIEFLVTLPPWMASALINAYKPLLVARQDLRDYFQLVIRKSLFHRDSCSRAVAINGFLTVMSLYGASRYDAHRHGSRNSIPRAPAQEPDCDIGTILDALQPLRRVFSYSAPLRALLYKNAIHYLQDADPERSSKMATALGEVLRVHLQTFVDPKEVPYVLVEHCVNESIGGVLLEPLGDLVWCLAVIESKRDPDSYEKSYIVELARRVASVSLQDFSITKELLTTSNAIANQPPEDAEAQNAEEASARATRNRVRVLGSVFEALIHAVLIIPPSGQDWSVFTEALVPLLVLKSKVFELLRDAGVSSSSDAFSDLGGDLAIERLRPGMRMLLQRGGRSSGVKGKRSSGFRKSKIGDASNSSGSGNIQVSDHRFGSFSILSSASSKPTLPLDVAMRTLRVMSEAMSQVNNNVPNLFHGHAESRDFQDLRVYLLAVAQKHVEDFISAASKDTNMESSSAEGAISCTIRAVESLVQMAMSDFKRFRRSASSTPAQGGVAALQIAERCACALTYLGKSNKAAVASFCKALMPSPSLIEPNSEGEIFEASVDALEQLVDSLVDDELFKEAAFALRMHDSVVHSITDILGSVEKRSAFLDKRVQWATEAISTKQICDTGIVKTLVQTCLVYTANNNDLRRAGHLCQRLLEVIGDCDENADPPERANNEEGKLCSALSIEQDNSLAVVDVVFDVIDHSISDVEWCLGRMNSLEAAINGTSIEVDSSHCKENRDDTIDALQQEAIAKQAIRAEDAAQVRLEGIVRTLTGLARCAIGKWGQQERLLRLITKTYKVACSATQAQAKRRGDPRTTFTSLINECKGLAPTLWTYLAFVAAAATDEKSTKGASRAAREARVMPQLVYEVERFEKVLIRAQKRTRINLLRGMRRNIARDFRIREDRLREEENSENDEGENRQSSGGEDQQAEQGGSSAKRRRT